MRISFAVKWILRTVFSSLAFFGFAVFILQTTEKKLPNAVDHETPDRNRKSFVYNGLRNSSPNEPEILPLKSFIKSTELFQIFTGLSNVLSPLQDLYNDLWYFDHPNATNKIPPVHHRKPKPHLSVKPRQIVILGAAPSSNSALVSLLQDYIPPSFVHYEPLQSIRKFDPVATPQEIRKALELIQCLIVCDRVPQLHLKFGKKFGNHQFRHNSHYATLCTQNRPECTHPTVTRTICSLSPIQILSTSQLSVELAARLLVDPALPLLKVVYVTKDPRRILQSNRRNFWCQYHSSCNNVTSVCQRIDQDLHYVEILRKKYPDRFITVADEDVISQPIPLLQQIIPFANLIPLSSKTLNRLTAKYRPLMQDTVLSPEIPHRLNDWQTKLTVAELCDIEQKCKNTLKSLQLPLITKGGKNCISN